MQTNPQLDTSVGLHPLLEALLTARLHDPFNYLGARAECDYTLVRVFYPYASRVWINTGGCVRSNDTRSPRWGFRMAWRDYAPDALSFTNRGQQRRTALPTDR